MIFIPMDHQETSINPTRLSRELGQRLDDVVRDYKRLHPELTDVEVRAALTTSLKQAGAPGNESRQHRVAMVTIASIVAVFIGVALSGGSRGWDENGAAFRIIGIVAAVGAVAFAALRFAKRDN